MVQKYARAACNNCHLRLPKPYLHSVTAKEQTGSSGWGYSLGRSVYGKKKNRLDWYWKQLQVPGSRNLLLQG